MDKTQNNDLITLLEHTQVGISVLKDAFNPDEILAYPDIDNQVFYFDKEKTVLIRKNYTVIEEKENEWMLKLPFGFGKFRIEPIEKLDFSTTKIRYYIPFIRKESKCYSYSKGECVTFHLPGPKGTETPHSFHAPVQFKGCRGDFFSDCYGLFAPLNVDYYDGYECQGPTKKKMIPAVLCAPPA